MFEALVPFLPAIVGGVLALVALGFAWLKGKNWIKEGFLVELERDVSAVVTEVTNTYVNERKKANEDGKLTEEEKKHARQLAIDRLKALGKEKGKNYAKTWLIPVIADLIEKWVNRKNKEKAEVAEAEANAEKAKAEATAASGG